MRNNDILMGALIPGVFVKYNFTRPNGQRVEVRSFTVLFVVDNHQEIIVTLLFIRNIILLTGLASLQQEKQAV